ncbi:hypothetical protein [Pedobacter namyangjuensis]|uniref:hypothetical protein n=1 Tax=Pedobacter namyangjuensis TaxID=600626 RepID=UPI000DE1D040|nr:hypothetical protein [Pedobacter namyangjuensis]
MNIKNIKIKKGQFIGHVLKIIPSNTIIQKPTGAGITTKEIEEMRNSIIIESNRPVIKGKAKKYNKGNTRNLVLRTVNEGVEVANIIDYLQSNVKYKKLITTPESYHKIVTAFDELGLREDMYKSYFLLFDECERTIQDIDYRKTIIQPMCDFFKFKKKAFVSATPIIPSDPRFKAQKFKMLVIEPAYDDRQNCQLVVTNNTMYSLQKYFTSSKAKEHFIFLNSTKAITTVIKYLDIASESLIFCSEESVNKLKLQGFKNARENLVDSKNFAKFNFFTSRFNSAVDIDDVIEPHIVIVTDTFLAEHTKVDPYTEVQQITGRFRRPVDGDIVRHLTHITNVSIDLMSTPEAQILKDIEIFKGMYEVLINYRDSSSSSFVWSVVSEMLERSEFSKYINHDGTTNYFMVDNAIYINRVNSYYQSNEKLISAYNHTSRFNLLIDLQNYELTDEHKAKLKEASKLSSSLELLLPILKELTKNTIDEFDLQLQLKQIEKEHPTAYNAFKILGFEKVRNLQFDYRKVKLALEKANNDTQYGHFKFLSFLDTNFKVGKSYSNTKIKVKLKKGVESFSLDRLKPNLQLLERYFVLSPRNYITTVNGKKVYGYLVLKNKFKPNK